MDRDKDHRIKGRSKPLRPANYDCIVVGAGAAGLTAAIALARKDFSVLVVEGAPFPGAENWSGCVYFTENLAHPEVLGPEGVERLAWERRLVHRGVFLTNGHSLAGLTYCDADAFRNCYTVLRPVFDRHLGQVAREFGVTILTDTTVDGLIREAGRVVGVNTHRGPLYAPLVFLAEGDASHLVSKEGYERRARAPEKPHFLQGVKQVIELDPEVIEARFGLRAGEGAAYEFLLRNGTLNGRPVTLNMGGFLYTNHRSVSLGFVLPVSKLAEGFEGNPHLLMEWIKGLPAIQRLIAGGKPGPFGAKIIRGGGEREIPYLVDHGLAIGGAASGIGIDFPYPNFTGPATAMGLALARAAERIRAAGGSYTLDELHAHYVQPLRRTHYAADVHYLQGWPSYVERTEFFFGRNLDAVLATLYTWTRPERSGWWKWWQWVRLLRTTLPAGKLGSLRRDARRLARTLDLPGLASGVIGWRTLLDGALNTLRDVTRTSRPRLSPAGALRYVYQVAEEPTGEGRGVDGPRLPAGVVRWGERLRPVLARAARYVYQNDRTPLRQKLRGALATLFDQSNFIDLIAGVGLLLAAGLSMPLQALSDRVRYLIRRPTVEEFLASFARRYVEATKRFTALEGSPIGGSDAATGGQGKAQRAPVSENHMDRRVGSAHHVAPDDRSPVGTAHPTAQPTPSLAQDWEEKLSGLKYFSDKRSHILLNWPDRLEQRARVADDALWHLCPAHVYECHTDVTGSIRLVANFENCVKCETCWRGSDLVDWGRDGCHRLIYPVDTLAAKTVKGQPDSESPVFLPPPRENGSGIAAVKGDEATIPALTEGHVVDYWQPHLDRLRHQLLAGGLAASSDGDISDIRRALRLVAQINRKAEELGEAVSAEPRTVDHPRARWIETLAGYLRPLAEELRDAVADDDFGRRPPPAPSPSGGGLGRGDGATDPADVVRQSLLAQIENLLGKIDDVLRHTWDRRMFWAVADARQIRGHHLVGLRRTLELLAPHGTKDHATGPLAGARGSEVSDDVLHADAVIVPDATVAPYLIAEQLADQRRALSEEFGRRLDQVFSSTGLRAIDRGTPPAKAQHRALAELLERIPVLGRDTSRGSTHRSSDTAGQASSGTQASNNGNGRSEIVGVAPLDEQAWTHPLERKVLLEELGRRDPSLAYAVSRRLLARDALALAGVAQEQFLAPGATAVFADEGPIEWLADDEQDKLAGEKTWVPAVGADWFVLLVVDRLVSLHRRTPGLRVERLETLGLRGCEPSRLIFGGVVVPPTSAVVPDEARVRRTLEMLACADLLSLGLGMAETLTGRAVEHALGRVQFPGLFHDEAARDGIGKFGAVKKMIAEIEARRFLLETLAYDPGMTVLDDASYEWAVQAKALAADALGSAPGSITYNAGQIFGGTGYSEDDILTKFYRDASTWRHLRPANPEVLTDVASRLASDSQPFHIEPSDDTSSWLPTLRQRKALWGEFDALRHAAADLNAALLARAVAGLEPARCALDLRAAWLVLRRVHARLEAGFDAELGVELLEVLIGGCTQKTQFLRRLAEHAPSETAEGGNGTAHHVAPAGTVYAASQSDASPLDLSYDELLAPAGTYDFGDFLLEPLDLTQPAYVPEMIERDARLREYDRKVYEVLHEHFGGRTFDGLPYDRYLESRHRMDDEHVALLVDHGFFRMPIPEQFGGEGRRKVDYYLLIKHALKQGDVSLALTIQANTSIGTTPVLLALKQDLPRAEADLKPWIENPERAAGYHDRLGELAALLDQPDPRKLEKPFRALAEDVQRELAGSAVLRSLYSGFLQAFQSAAIAGKKRDLAGFAEHLKTAADRFESETREGPSLLEELGRRREACEQFLRWIASGQISAFALTEPSAGSDTARIATRAVPKSAEVHVRADGMLTFRPDGADEDRVLLDASRLEFQSAKPGDTPRALYRWSDAHEPSEIHFDEYDYETYDPLARRYYDHGGRKVYFTDIAQIRRRGGRLYYDYWQLDGAKMWITNGRLAGVMVLYAKTEAGVTAFLVDRHAEGLVVGKDEEKMGQCGSPTNELSLAAVRVPREQVAGLEGRGQVNALETLNVGRAGLAVSAVSLMGDLINEAARFAHRRWERLPDWVIESLEAMRDEQFACESLAYELIGRFDHPGTRSVRMESAIAKLYVSEALHRLIERAEDLYGLLGQTRVLRIEKHKRDARILNIYEGTNEVGRFFVLKDLVNEVAPRYQSRRSDKGGNSQTLEPGGDVGASPLLEGHVEQFEACRAALLERVEKTRARFGRDAWLNPNLQGSLFTLSEAAATMLVLASSLRRSRMLLADTSGPETASQLLERAGRLTHRLREEIDALIRQFDEQFEALGHGFYPPHVRAAELAYERGDRTKTRKRSRTRSLARSIAGSPTRSGPRRNVLVVIEPQPEFSPEPVIRAGQLAEVYYRLDGADAAALNAALHLAAHDGAHVTVAAVGPRRQCGVLREALALGADEAILVDAPQEPVDPAAAAEALALSLSQRGHDFDLLLTRPAGSEGEAGRLGPLLAARMGLPWYGTRRNVAFDPDAGPGRIVLESAANGSSLSPRYVFERATLPAACALEADSAPLPRFTTTGWLASLARPLTVQPWPAEVRLPDSRVQQIQAVADARAGESESSAPRSPADAALLFGAMAGLRSAVDAGAKRDDVPKPPRLADAAGYGWTVATRSVNDGRASAVIEPVDLETRYPLAELDAPCVLAVAMADREGRLSASEQAVLALAGSLARQRGARAAALVLCKDRASAQDRLIHALSAADIDAAWFWHHRHFSPDVPELGRRALEAGWQRVPHLAAVVAGAWAGESLAVLAEQSRADNGGVAAMVFGAGACQFDRTTVTAEVPLPQGRLVRSVRHVLDDEAPLWLCLAESYESASPVHATSSGPENVWMSEIPLEDWFSRETVAHALRAARGGRRGSGGLAEAEIVVDVGSGIRNRDGIEAVIDPLVALLKRLGIGAVEVGGSRKVTEELGLLPADRQIGQTGRSVNPKLLLAIGISGAPQHLGYIGPRATIFSFNRDPEAPIMTLNRRTPQPRVVPILGDLFETVPAFTHALAGSSNDLADSDRAVDEAARVVRERAEVAPS